MSSSPTPASARDFSITGVISSRWCLEATSGTTPPNFECASWEETTLERTAPPSSTAAQVSSQEVSIASCGKRQAPEGRSAAGRGLRSRSAGRASMGTPAIAGSPFHMIRASSPLSG